jgi:hypothetical protein
MITRSRSRASSPSCPSLLHGRAPLSRLSSFRPGTSRWDAIRYPPGLLPALPHQFDRFNRIKIGIEHPMVSPTQIRQVGRVVVSGFVIKMGNRQTGLYLKTADDTTDERIMLARDAASLNRVAWQLWQGFIAHCDPLPSLVSVARFSETLDRMLLNCRPFPIRGRLPGNARIARDRQPYAFGIWILVFRLPWFWPSWSRPVSRSIGEAFPTIPRIARSVRSISSTPRATRLLCLKSNSAR